MRTILLFSTLFSTYLDSPENFKEPSKDPLGFFHKTFKQAFYCGAGSLFSSSANLAYLSGKFLSYLPWTRTTATEFFLLSELCSSISKHTFDRAIKEYNSLNNPNLSWELNQRLLTNIPASTSEELELLRFLQERWLAKIAGFSTFATNWVYPCFDINVQVHPFTNHSYARLLTSSFPKAYTTRINEWKKELPFPDHYPLILTRKANLKEYLPAYLEVSSNEIKSNDHEKIIVDVSSLFSKGKEEWYTTWKAHRNELATRFLKQYGDLDKILCIQRIDQKDIGGIVLLELPRQSEETLKQNHLFLLDWVSCFGLTANRIELDRWPVAKDEKNLSSYTQKTTHDLRKEIQDFEIGPFSSQPPHIALMLKGTLQVLSGLFAEITDEKWTAVHTSFTKSSIVQISTKKILEELYFLKENKFEGKNSFFDMASHLEQIHAHLTALLEIFSPFEQSQFSSIYQKLLPIPHDLKPLTSLAIHSSAMTSLAGIFKAAEKMKGQKPTVLFGENTYFECINAAKKATHAISIKDASLEDWENADLILAQFNPVIQLGILPQYKTENIKEVLLKSLKLRDKKPITLALDSTIDYIWSSKLEDILTTFEKEIREGLLNIVCYRSGLKFDIFGMDNYCGSPFFMIHNENPKWASFDSLLEDPILQTDSLSCNWFCLAYQYAAPQLDLYRKQIFDNTWALLHKLPSRLLNHETSGYHITPFDEQSDPAFIDIKITESFHMMKASALVAGLLYIKSMEGGHPIFNRPSLGFYHPNFIMLFNEDNSTLRLTLGLDPDQVDLFANCFEIIDKLNN